MIGAFQNGCAKGCGGSKFSASSLGDLDTKEITDTPVVWRHTEGQAGLGKDWRGCQCTNVARGDEMECTSISGLYQARCARGTLGQSQACPSYAQ